MKIIAVHTLKSKTGITLIELLIVIVIVGILAAIAVPLYTGYMQRARRVDAKTALEQVRAAQEMFRAERGRYANDGDDGNALTALQNTCGGVSATSGDYNIGFTLTNRNSFTAQAAPFTTRQGSDGSLFINYLGQKWDKDNKYYPQGIWAK